VPARSGRSQVEVLDDVFDAVRDWVERIVER
jgi:hypothetical protein